jgi:hypothetical protein
MRPIKVLELQNKHEVDLIATCVLDVLSDFKGSVSTQTLVDECSQDGVSSPATTNRKISLLKGKNFIDSKFIKDKRQILIKVSSTGMNYLKEWEKNHA